MEKIHLLVLFGLVVLTSYNNKIWNVIRSKYKIDSLEKYFLEKYGEDEFNILSLKTSENFESKMNYNNQNYIKTSP